MKQFKRNLVTGIFAVLAISCTKKLPQSTSPMATLRLISSLNSIQTSQGKVSVPVYALGLLPAGAGPGAGDFQKPCASRPGKAHPDQGSGVCTGNNYIEVALPTSGLSLSYNSQAHSLQRGFGYGFSLSLDEQVFSDVASNRFYLHQGDGSIISHHISGVGEWASDDVRLVRSVFQANGANLVQLLPESEKAEFSLFSSGPTNRYLLSRYLDKNGNATQILRNADGLITKIIDPFGKQAEISYASGLASTLKDNAGNVYSFSYDSSQRLIAVTQPDGRASTFSYKPEFAWITGSKMADGEKLEYTYYLGGDLESIKNQLGYVTAIYYEPNQVKVKTSLDTEVEKFDSQGRLLSYEKNGVATLYTRDANGLVVSEKDAVGLVTSYSYTSTNGIWDPRPSSIIYPNNGGTTTIVQAGGLNPGPATQLTHVQGATKTVTLFDPIHEGVTKISKGALGQDVTTISYDVKGNPLNTYRNGVAVEKLTYDAFGRVVSQADAVGATTAFTYDAKGNLASEVDHFGRVTSYQHDALGNVTEVSSPTRKSSQQYDVMGEATGKSALESKLADVGEISSTRSISYQASGAPDKESVIHAVAGAIQSSYEALFDLLPWQVSSRVIKSSDGAPYNPDK